MKTKIILTLGLALSTTLVFSQGLMVGVTGKQLKQTPNKEVTGSPYFLSDSFVKSKIVTLSNKKLDINALRYNLYTQDVEYKDQVATYAVQDSLQSFTMPDSAGKTLEFVRKKVNNEDGFYQVVVSGKVELLKRYTAKSETTTDWYTKKEIKAMKHHITYFSNKDGKIEKLSVSSKGLLTLFGDKAAVVKTYIKEQSPDLKTEEGLADVFKIYNASN